MKQCNRITIQSAQGLDKVISHLESLVNALEKCRVTVSRGDDVLSLVPRGPIAVEMLASEHGKKQRVHIDLSWKKHPGTAGQPHRAFRAGAAPAQIDRERDATGQAPPGQDDATAVAALRVIPNVGMTTARELVRIGITAVDDLRGRDPEELYREYCARAGRENRRMLYVLRCAVYFATRTRHSPKLLHWSSWKTRTRI